MTGTVIDEALVARALKIRCVFLDIDGVLTDCRLWLGPDGTEWKTVHVRDGLGIKMLLRAGIEVAVISGRPSAAMQLRLESLGGIAYRAVDRGQAARIRARAGPTRAGRCRLRRHGG